VNVSDKYEEISHEFGHGDSISAFRVVIPHKMGEYSGVGGYSGGGGGGGLGRKVLWEANKERNAGVWYTMNSQAQVEKIGSVPLAKVAEILRKQGKGGDNKNPLHVLGYAGSLDGGEAIRQAFKK